MQNSLPGVTARAYGLAAIEWMRQDVPTRLPEPGVDALDNPVVQEFFSRLLACLPTLIECIAASPAMLARLAAGSFAHPNDFIKIPLFTDRSNGCQLRLHIWDRDHADADVHDHRWPFWSVPVVGRLDETRFVVTPGDNFALMECTPRDAEEHIHVTEVSRVAIKEREQAIRDTGRIYECEEGEYHRLETLGDRGLTATLMLRGASVRERALIMKKSDQDTGSSSYLLPSLAPERLSEHLVEVLDRL